MTDRSNPVDPAPLALGAFAGNTFLLSIVNTGLVDKSAIAAAIATAWAFGGLIQIAVGFWQLRDGRLFPAVTFGSYGAFWMSFGAFETFYADKLPPAAHGTVTALFLTPWIIFTLYMLVGALRTNIALVIAFVLVEAVLIPTAAGFRSGSPTLLQAGGCAGLALAAVVWYVAAAEVLQHQFGRTVLPLGSLARPAPQPLAPATQPAITPG